MSGKAKRTKRGKNWRKVHSSDGYVREAVRLGVRSRSYFKLQEIDQHYRLFDGNQKVLDLGAAPGGWCQYVVTRVGSDGKVYAVDILEMKPLNNVHFIHCNITEQESRDKLALVLGGQTVDVLLSDIAPNLTGNSAMDSRNFWDVYDAIFDVCELVLVHGGSLVFKFFQDQDSISLKNQLESKFRSCTIFKPKASRSRSQESYLVARGWLRTNTPLAE